jgi:hypothetical protein
MNGFAFLTIDIRTDYLSISLDEYHLLDTHKFAGL